MKKKIIALVLAASAVMGSAAFAQTFKLESTAGTKAIVMCYDENGKLVYSKLCKAENGSFETDIPSEYDGMRKRVYYVDTKEFKDLTAESTPAPTPSATEKPAATAKPTATPKPTKKPSEDPPIYEKAVDAIYAPALVKDIETRTNSNDEDMYAVTLFYHGKEMTIGIEEDLTISTAPEEYSSMKGKTMDSLQRGDVICLTANVAGDTIRTVDFIFRPTEEDIATGDTDYGTNFEKLFAANNKVANQWTVMKYGEKPSSDRYQYAFGIIGKKDGNVLTLINKDGDEDNAIEVDMQSDTMVYTCAVDGKEYEVEIGDTSSIETTIPKSMFDRGPVELNDDYSYNYALVRMVDGIATDIVLYNNYNN